MLGYIFRNFLTRYDKTFRLFAGSAFWSLIGFAASTIAVEFFVYTYAIINHFRVPVGEVDFIRVLVGYLYIVCLVVSAFVYRIAIWQRYSFLRLRRRKDSLKFASLVIISVSSGVLGNYLASTDIALFNFKSWNSNYNFIIIASFSIATFYYIIKISQSRNKLFRTKFSFFLICLSFATTSAIMLQSILNYKLIGIIGYGDRSKIIIQWKNKDGDCYERTVGKFIFRSDEYIVFSTSEIPEHIYEMKMSLVCYVGYSKD